MDKTKEIIGGICVVLGFIACAENDYVVESQHGGDRISLRSEVVQEYTTRANDGGFTDNDQIGVFIVNYDLDGNAQLLKTTGNHADNVRFTFHEDQNQWESSYPLYWKDKNTHVDAYGYYPFDNDLLDVEAYPFSIHRNQRDVVEKKTITGYEASDFLWTKTENISPGTFINLKHQHIMAGVEVTLLEGDYFDEGEWETLTKNVLIQNTCTNAIIDLGTGKVMLADNVASSIIPQQRDAVWRAIVAPQTVGSENALLAITVDGISYDFLRDEAMTYFPGKLHKFAISVNKRLPEGDYQFTLVSEAITPWENDAESHNGAAREYVTVHVEEGEYIGDVFERMKLDPSEIINLKLTGTLVSTDYYSDAQFGFIREKMSRLEALNMKDLRTKNMTSFKWEGGWGDPPYNQPTSADDYLPREAFKDMVFLSYVVFPDSLKGLGDEAFACTGLKGSLILPEGLKHIGGSCFVGRNYSTGNLTGELYIPSSVDYIADYAFGTLYFTNELILPERMAYLGNNAFINCGTMTGTIHVPDGITDMTRAWPDQIGGQVVIPQGVKKITGFPRGAVSVVIPEGVETIEYGAFSWTKKLRNIHLPKTIKSLSESSFEQSGVTHINLPEGIEIIESSTFRGCENLLDTITIPSTVTQIRTYAFAGCRQLSAVILPEGLEEIQGSAFRDCYSLDYIQCLGNIPPRISGDTFSGVEKDNFTVVVPEGAVDAYRNAEHWREFKRISAYRNFVCRPMQVKLLNKGHVRDIVLNADDNWTVTYCPDWITLDKTSGYKKTELQATIATMPHGQGDRKDSIVFQLDKLDEDGNSINCSYVVQQFDFEYEEDGVQQLQKATKGLRGGIDILFVGDGYDAEDIAKGTYRQQIEEEMEYFFAVEPYMTYKDYFNVSMAFAMSLESGVQDSPDKWRNTKFNITYGAGSDGRLSVPFDEIGRYVFQDVENSPITEENNSRSMVICVPNSDAYEGVTSVYGNGFSIAICPHSTFDYPNDARGIIQHEAGGHGWGRLDDEYIYHQAFIQTCTCVDCSHVSSIVANHADNFGRNVSLNGGYQQVEWKHLIFDSRYGDIVDIYEGAHMHARGVYRSELNSCMNNNVPYYSTWSRQLIVERILEAAGETFDFETFVKNDSREMGDKFLTRAQLNTPWHSVKAVHSEHHGTILKKGSPFDYIKKRRK